MNDIESGQFFADENDKDKLINDSSIRLGFIRKVLGILSFQLALTVAFTLFTMNIPDYKLFVKAHPGLLIFAVCLELAIAFTLICYRDVARRTPTNYGNLLNILVLLGIFTISVSYIVKKFNIGFMCLCIIRSLISWYSCNYDSWSNMFFNLLCFNN